MYYFPMTSQEYTENWFCKQSYSFKKKQMYIDYLKTSPKLISKAFNTVYINKWFTDHFHSKKEQKLLASIFDIIIDTDFVISPLCLQVIWEDTHDNFWKIIPISYYKFWVKILKTHYNVVSKEDITNFLFQNYPKGIIQNPDFIEDIKLPDFDGFKASSFFNDDCSLDYQLSLYIILNKLIGSCDDEELQSKIANQTKEIMLSNIKEYTEDVVYYAFLYYFITEYSDFDNGFFTNDDINITIQNINALKGDLPETDCNWDPPLDHLIEKCAVHLKTKNDEIF